MEACNATERTIPVISVSKSNRKEYLLLFGFFFSPSLVVLTVQKKLGFSTDPRGSDEMFFPVKQDPETF